MRTHYTLDKPYYTIDEKTLKKIIALSKECRKIGFKNVSFHYSQEDISFQMNKYTNYWELIVKQNREKKRDTYRLIDRSLKFDYSEQD